MKKIWVVAYFLISSVAYGQTEPAPVPVEPTTNTPAATPSSAPAKESAKPIAASVQEGPDTVPSLNRPNPVSFNARLGAGSAFGPSAFWMEGDLEAQLDKFVALGPKVQYGTNSTTDFLFTSFGPRFTIPTSFFEVGLHAGFGLAYRNTAGFEFSNFLFESGANFDIYLLKNLSVGLGYNVNFLSSAAETFMSALILSASGHF
jgi:hypothetical protein